MDFYKVIIVFLFLVIFGLILRSPIQTGGLNMTKQTTSLLDTISVIHQRKSVRKFTTQELDKETLTQIVKAGMAAPTAANKQPWAFVTITDRKILDQLADNLQYAKMLKTAPAAIIVIGLPQEALPGKDAEYWIQDCSAASQNILLATEALGLGAVWTGVYPNIERVSFVQKELGLSEEQIPLNVIALGHPDGNFKAQDKFKAEKIHWNRW